jgi:hypothetical protein
LEITTTGQRREVLPRGPASDWPTGPWETAHPRPALLFPLFYLVEIRHRQLFNRNFVPDHEAGATEYTM